MEEEKQHKEKFSGESMQEKAGQRQEWTDEQIERLLEAIHQAARMDREMMAERLERRLAALSRARRMRRIRWMAGSVAAAIIVLVLVWRPWMEVEPERVMPVAQITLPEITVPTVIATGTADEILEVDTLETGITMPVYEVRKEQPKEERVLPREVKYNRVVIPRGCSSTFDTPRFSGAELCEFYENRVWNNCFAKVVPAGEAFAAASEG